MSEASVLGSLAARAYEPSVTRVKTVRVITEAHSALIQHFCLFRAPQTRGGIRPRFHQQRGAAGQL